MVLCTKKNGKPCRTVDFQALNLHATHETHHTQSPFHQARSIRSDKKKTVFDCWNGYHSVPLHADDCHLTTFITAWGRYRYKTVPQGYIASGDGYSKRFDEIVSHIPNKTKCIDYTLLWANNLTESFSQAVDWLDMCGRHGITLNPDKFVFGQDTVEFAGFENTPTNVRPCRKYLDASTSRRDLHDRRYRNNCVLARHHPSYHRPTDKLQQLQPHATSATQRTTISICATSIPLPMRVRRFFHYKGVYYLAVVDRYSNWPIIERAQEG